MDGQTARPQLVFKRYEQKYLLDRMQLAALERAMASRMTPDEHGESSVTSIYLDTPTHLLVRRSLEGGTYKEKLRVRCYGELTPSSPLFVEVKKKCSGVVYKRRIPTSPDGARLMLGDPDVLLECARTASSTTDAQIMRETAAFLRRYDSLAPSICVTYQRRAFFAKDDPDFRVTLDTDIRWFSWDDPLVAPWLNGGPRPLGSELLLPDQTLMEVKLAESMPLWMARVISREHVSQTSFSKVGRAYQALCERDSAVARRPRLAAATVPGHLSAVPGRSCSPAHLGGAPRGAHLSPRPMTTRS